MVDAGFPCSREMTTRMPTMRTAAAAMAMGSQLRSRLSTVRISSGPVLMRSGSVLTGGILHPLPKVYAGSGFSRDLGAESCDHVDEPYSATAVEKNLNNVHPGSMVGV